MNHQKTSVNGPFSMAMLNNQRVYLLSSFPYWPRYKLGQTPCLPMVTSPMPLFLQWNHANKKQNTCVYNFYVYIIYMVGGIPTPLKNDGLRQLGLLFPTEWKVIKLMFQTTNQSWFSWYRIFAGQMAVARDQPRPSPWNLPALNPHDWERELTMDHMGTWTCSRE